MPTLVIPVWRDKMMAPTPMTRALEHFFEAAWHRTAMLNRRMIGLAHSNLKFGLELARAKTLSDVVSLQAGYWRQQFNTFQAEDFSDLLSAAGEPPSPDEEAARPETKASLLSEAGEPRDADEDPVRPHTKAETVESLVVADAPEEPKQKSARKPVRKAAAPDRQEERKSAKGSPKPAPGGPSSSEARAPERKGRARGRDAVLPSAMDKVRFGMLDGNAVRFTSREAWVLLDRAWRPIPVGEVLSDAAVLSQARFDKLYPEVPQLPAAAFQPKDKKK